MLELYSAQDIFLYGGEVTLYFKPLTELSQALRVAATTFNKNAKDKLRQDISDAMANGFTVRC